MEGLTCWDNKDPISPLSAKTVQQWDGVQVNAPELQRGNQMLCTVNIVQTCFPVSLKFADKHEVRLFIYSIQLKMLREFTGTNVTDLRAERRKK